MHTLYIELRPSGEQTIELRYYNADSHQIYETQRLRLSDIQTLIDQSEQDFYVSVLPDPVQIGKKLFAWLDGASRHLTGSIDNCQEDGLILAIDSGARLSHLPWEVLHNGQQYLIDRVRPKIVPVRWTRQKIKARSPQTRPLQVMFMATSPEPPLEPILQFEREEALILENTKGIPLDLRVEESGCIGELKRLWLLFPEHHFDVFHLTGHASIKKIDSQQTVPYFVTETLEGRHYDASAREIAEALSPRFPQLVFLSGCRTGQAGNEGAVPSMAQQLIDHGIRAVLGWGYPIADLSATTAAAQLYADLAAGNELAQALSSAYRKLREANVADWYFLRLYVLGECPGAMVVPSGRMQFHYDPREIELEDCFLNPDDPDSPEVVPSKDFVGRRRSIQRCLQHLRLAPGILIHGIGGVGKTTLAKRLLERLPDYDLIFNRQDLTPDKLRKSLLDECTTSQGLEALKNTAPLRIQLINFFKFESQKPFLFVLDDFEKNLELNAIGEYVLKREAVDALEPLLEVVKDSGIHRVIITSRYNFKLEKRSLNDRLKREPLTAFRGADLRKKLDRLEAFDRTSQSIDALLQEQAIALADGNPRLLEWLAKVLTTDYANPEGILNTLRTRAEEYKQEISTEAERSQSSQQLRQHIQSQIEDKVAAFRVNILAEELLKQQPEELRQMLSLGLLFDLPVPRSVFTSLCRAIENLDQYLRRASDLGLIEVFSASDLLRVPRLLAPFLNFPTQPTPLYRIAAQLLYQTWWLQSQPSEEQQREIHRLACLGEESAIAVKIAIVLTEQWLPLGRYAETKTLCQQTLKLSNDYRILHNLAQAEQYTGDPNAALEHSQQALKGCPSHDGDRKALIIALLAALLSFKGLKGQAAPLYEQLQTVADVQGKAKALGEVALLKATQGEFDLAYQLVQKALEIDGQFNNSVGIAQTLQIWAMIKTEEGQYNESFRLYNQAAEIWKSLGKLQELSATLQRIGGLHLQLNQWQEASQFLEEAIDISKNIGEVQSQIEALASLGTIGMTHGELDNALDALEQAQELCEQIGNNLSKPTIMYRIGCIHAMREDLGQAISVLEQTVQEAERTGNIGTQIQTLLLLGRLKREFLKSFVEYGYQEVMNHFAEAQALCDRIESKQMKIIVIDQLAALVLMHETKVSEAEAIALYQQAADISEDLGNVPLRADVLSSLGYLLAKQEARKEQGEFQVATQHLQQALEIMEQLDPMAVDYRIQQEHYFTPDNLVRILEDVRLLSGQTAQVHSGSLPGLQEAEQVFSSQQETGKYQLLIEGIHLIGANSVSNCSSCGSPISQDRPVCAYCGTKNLIVPSTPTVDAVMLQIPVARIVLKRGGGLTTEAFTIKGRAVIGRSSPQSTSAVDIDLSRLPEAINNWLDYHHAEIWRDTVGKWWIKDLGSKNGTFISTHPPQWLPVREKHIIHHGSQIAFANIPFEFQIDR
ncbi:hypothetical protein NIES2135_09610 [Leptolyngbya boryana NIES-2135]|jgi:tetratricopeptide (TPR) repeat protein|uniref:FHA domain-containing protein n=1 Tax=Leptolyngbya boryana NIES-2135 TaxID=1973484 RepID=A0A1Z4JCF5_LEPBY|nr:MULTISPECIES: tetratricopeptide repeat protein [Leptolyngbya]BAY54147.1 hypothetical protein NIES2135_09610 [Leptolyngbya boryana NIES-2135]MBD2371019.1 tetratricopeptide repeat protein [Leptolyngbya sp. FACHB-161]MBD2377523.1 tetratricopeptide repeat protein [Leptolyngbya sp. FACHB-238]MBD2401931.1 tetratricopeptide repeat protein [Leptolyngbya sp. FACHB-239]MBD2408449.1 tetratricopeptide repeat protein [Leptolyngbya sp. FACHB-402]